MKIPFNKPFIAGTELYHIAQAVTMGNIGADGEFTKRCARFFEQKLDVPRVLLTPSCTAALEMAAQLCGIEPGDEVILPSYTFVSTANAFVRFGAKPVFVDIRPDTLNLDESKIESAITERTRAIVPVHYAGVGCEMNKILELAKQYGLRVVEDAAQAVNSTYQGKFLGGLGDFGTFSFHETKNYICGEGGALCVSRPEFVERAEIIRDKGTNRSQFLRGQIDKYTWVDIGSSYVPSEINCAYLWAQLELMDSITQRRKNLYQRYEQLLAPLQAQGLLETPRSGPGNYHMFYILLPDEKRRNALMKHLNERQIQAVFHYIPLHSSPMGKTFGYDHGDFPITEQISSRILRLPFFYDLSEAEQLAVVTQITTFLRSNQLQTRASVPNSDRAAEL